MSPKNPNSAASSAGESSFGYHRVTTFQTCKRKYAYKYLLRLELPVMPRNLAMGSMVHLALMHYYLRRAGHQDVIGPVEAMHGADARMAWIFQEAKDVVERYLRWAGGNDALAVLDVEREYEVNLGGRVLTARIDLTFEANGQVFVNDHKSTAGDVTKHHIEWSRRGQMATLDAIGASVFPAMYGLPYGGITITAISTQKVPEVDAIRSPLEIEPGWQETVLQGLAASLEEIDSFEKREVQPWEYPIAPEACRGRYGWCEFLPLCRFGKAELGRFTSVVDDATKVAEGSSGGNS